MSAALTRIVRVCRVRSRTDLSTRGHVGKNSSSVEQLRSGQRMSNS